MVKSLHSLLSTSSSTSSVWSRVRQLFHIHQQTVQDNESWVSKETSESSEGSVKHQSYKGRQEYKTRQTLSPPIEIVAMIPPFSPTYAKTDEFPYSNFYRRLPNGKWMVRYRSGNRDILGTDEIEGYMI